MTSVAPSTDRPPVSAGPMVPHRYRVVDTRVELAEPRTITLALEPVDEPLAPFRAGQFNMVWSFGVGEVPISVSGDPTVAGPLIHTVRGVGAVTSSLCDARVGDVVGLRGPYGTDWDVSSATGHDVVIIGGGIGLAPLRPVVDEVLARRDDFGRVALLVGARSPAELLFAEELERWRGRFDLDVWVTVDRAGSGWHGDVGVVTMLVPRVLGDPERTIGFVCGPEVMMRFVANGLLERGLEPGNVRVSIERNMKCAIAQCGHCQFGAAFVCREGPVFTYEQVAPLLRTREL